MASASGERAAGIEAAIRPRERLLQHGAHTLTDAELLAVLLGAGRAGRRAVAVADRLLRAVGGVPGLARCHPEALCQLPGLSEVTAARLLAALALPMRDLLATVLCHDGHAFGIAHTHPSGDPTPSVHDRNTTLRCRGAAEATGLTLLGYLVLGEHDSWAQA
jgi:DNA repair protein RadC